MAETLLRPAGVKATFSADDSSRVEERYCLAGSASQEDAYDALQELEVPYPGDKSDTLSNAEVTYYVDGIDLEWTEAENTWYAVVHYERDPLELPPEINFGGSARQEALCKDEVTNLPVRNSARDPFKPPLQRTRAFGRMEILTRQTDWDCDLIIDYKDHVNSDRVTVTLANGRVRTFQPGYLYLQDIRAVFQKRPRLHYRVNWVFEFGDGVPGKNGVVIPPFVRRVLDAGPHWLDTDGKQRTFGDRNGVIAAPYGLLDGSGGAYNQALDPNGTGCFLTFNGVPARAFTPLKIFDATYLFNW